MILLILVGIFVGVISGFFGIGGGTIIVPIMISLGFGVKEAIGISILQMLMSSVVGSYFNYKNADFKIKEALNLGLGALCGASLSGFVVSSVDEIWLKLAIIVALLISLIKIFYFRPGKSEKKVSNLVLFIIGFCIALVAISMGIGGAVFLTPILSGFLGMDIKKSVSLGLFFVIFSSFAGFISLSIAGLVNYKIGFIVGIGSLIGVYFGTKIHHKVSSQTQKYCLMVLYIAMIILTLNSLIPNLK